MVLNLVLMVVMGPVWVIVLILVLVQRKEPPRALSVEITYVALVLHSVLLVVKMIV